jgi:peroxiredoxin
MIERIGIFIVITSEIVTFKLTVKRMQMKWLPGYFAFFFLMSTFTVAQRLSTDGRATIRLSSPDLVTDIPISVDVIHSFPAYGFYEQQDTLSATHRTIWLSFPVHTLQQVIVMIDSKKLDLLMLPSDTISINIDSSKPNITYQIEGKNKQIQDYYQARFVQFPVSAGQQLMNAGAGDVPLGDFKILADSLLDLEMAFLNKHAKALPSWFIRYETDAIRYTNAYIRLYSYHYRQTVKQLAVNAPVNYFNFLQTLPIRNAAALYDYAYLSFLREYVIYTSTNKGLSPQLQDNILFEYRNNVELFGNRIGEFFTLFTISELLNDNPRQVERDLAELPALKSYSSLLPYLKESASQRINLLGTGKNSPNFILPDALDSLVSLKQFRGQVVYLSFWFAGCKGCIKEFPYENELVAKFKGKPVQIISICTRTAREKWLKKISQYDLKTLNLYANSQWRSTLEKKFGINVYPQYVLIGPDGNIIENFTSRPSNGAYDKIMNALSTARP